MPVPAAPAPDEGVAEDGGGAVGEDAGDDREVITNGYLTITAESPVEAADEAVAIVEGVGGRIDSRTEYAPVDGDDGRASLTLRIPADELTGTLDALEELGEVEEVSIQSDDVTREVQDLDARITALEASTERLLTLMATATDTKALIELESAISERQAELESLQAQRRGLDDQVSLSTVTLDLISEAESPVDEPDTFLTGLIAGWESLLAFLTGLLVVLGVLLPWLLLLGLLGLIVLLVLRRRRKRARAVGAPAAEGPVTAARQDEAPAP